MFALCFGLLCTAKAQFDVVPGKSCSVILLNHQWLINSYQKDEKIRLSKNSKGLISVHETGDLTTKAYKETPIAFKVGILKRADNTMTSFSDKTFNEIEVNEILKKCELGDKIIILLAKDGQYSLPHHQIEVI